MTYIGFLLGSMEVDYLPRLTEAIHRHERATKLVNEQTEMMLLIAGPILLGILTISPWLVQMLYSTSFIPAVEILQWQVLGDILKLIGWPMGFIILAKGRGKLFMATQFHWNAIYLLILWLGIESMGIIILGVGFFVAYIFQVGLLRIVAGRLIGFSFQQKNLYIFFSLLLAAGFILIVAREKMLTAAIAGGFLTLFFATYSFWRLNQLLDLKEYLHQFIKRFN
jgi:PST family polysaccharide transporter